MLWVHIEKRVCWSGFLRRRLGVPEHASRALCFLLLCGLFSLFYAISKARHRDFSVLVSNKLRHSGPKQGTPSAAEKGLNIARPVPKQRPGCLWPKTGTLYADKRGLVIRPETYLHMVQGEEQAAPFWKNVSKRLDSKLVFLSWRRKWTNPPAGVIYIPFVGKNSSYARGRNRMMAAGEKLEHDQGWLFEYFIFWDEDLSGLFVHASTHKKYLSDFSDEDYPRAISVLHRFLKEYRPVRAGGDRTPSPPQEVVTCESTPTIDTALDAYHRSAVNLILPYDDRFDDLNIWLSAFLVNGLVDVLFQPYSVFLHQICWNAGGVESKHGNYPKKGGVDTGTALLALVKYVHECFPKNSRVRLMYGAPEQWPQAGVEMRQGSYKECVQRMPATVNYASCGKVEEVAEHWIAHENAGSKCRPDLIKF